MIARLLLALAGFVTVVFFPATADEPAYTATAFGVSSMECITDDPGATITYTLRTAGGATTPSVTCSTATGAARTCVANIQTTVDIASGATVAIAVASTGNIGTVKFFCKVNTVF